MLADDAVWVVWDQPHLEGGAGVTAVESLDDLVLWAARGDRPR